MAKSRVTVVVDSTSTIPPNLVEKYNIQVIPQILNWEGQSLLDDIDIKPTAFYSRLRNAKELPTTSQPSAGEFFDFFKKVAESADSIIAVLISEYLSGTLASAHAAAEMLEGLPLEIVDTRSTSMGQGFMALEAARAVERGQSHVEAAQVARALIPKMRVVFVVDTLEFLHRGGRIGGAKRLVGSMLAIKPLLHLEDGRIEPLASVRTKRKAVDRALEIAAEQLSGKQGIHAAVIHASAPDEAQEIMERIKSSFEVEELYLTELSPVVGAHVGPGTVGIAYYSET